MRTFPSPFILLAAGAAAFCACDASDAEQPTDSTAAAVADDGGNALELQVEALLDEADVEEWQPQDDALPAGSDALTAEAPATTNLLPAFILEFAKSKVVEISEANTERRDNLEAVRLQLLPYIAILALDFAADRPDDEVELTQRTWKNIWDDSADLDDAPGTLLDRNNIFQVVEDGFYYNVSNTIVVTQDGGFPVQSFLKGNYELDRPATEDNEGEFALNVIDLEFSASVARPGTLPTDRPIGELALEIDEFVTTGSGVGVPPFETPGPIGVTGNLFNLYVDDELRISLGVGDPDGGASEEPAIFVLTAAEFAGPITISP